MKNIIFIVLITSIATSVVYAQSHTNWFKEINKQKVNNYQGVQSKKNISKFISANGNIITPVHIKKMDVLKAITLNSLGVVDIIKVSLINIPTVLKSNFFVVIDNQQKDVKVVSADYLFLVQGRSNGKKYIAGINNFRGDLQLILFKISRAGFTPNYQYNLNKYSDCIKYEPESLSLLNLDLNKDHRLDVRISFKQNYFCDKDGIESETSRSQKVIYKDFFALLTPQGYFWSAKK